MNSHFHVLHEFHQKWIVKIDRAGNTATKSKQKLLPCIALFWPRRFAVLLSSITKQMFFKWVPPKPFLKRNWRLANAHAALFLKQKSFNLPFKIEVSLFSFGIAPLIFYLIGAPIFVFMKKKNDVFRAIFIHMAHQPWWREEKAKIGPKMYYKQPWTTYPLWCILYCKHIQCFKSSFSST